MLRGAFLLYDATSGFQQVKLSDESIELITFWVLKTLQVPEDAIWHFQSTRGNAEETG